MATINIPLAFAILVASILIIHITIKMQYGFWYYQPVVKTYQFWVSLSPPSIISELPSRSTCTGSVPSTAAHSPALPAAHSLSPYLILDPKVIATRYFDTLSADQQTNFITLVSNHYLRSSDGNVYSPKPENVLPYFSGHDAPCFISFYFTPHATQKDNSIVVAPEPVGLITSRPLLVTYDDQRRVKKDIQVYYVDFLCVNRLHRRKGIAARLIQTHEYWQRQWNRQVAVSLFKHETDVLQGVVPLTAYTTYGFNGVDIIGMQAPAVVAPPYKMGVIKTANMHDLYDFMQKCRMRYKVFISTSIANVMSLCESKNIYIHVITDMDTKNIVAAYFYKNTCVSWDATTGNKVLMLEGSLSLLGENSPMFLAGFSASYRAIAKKDGYGICGIESIAGNRSICDWLMDMRGVKPIVTTPTAYFFYNFKHPTVNAGDVFVLH